ncbi:MAG: DUF547 domain-containing protein [Saprospiraceae bacterium]|nr:DUF547 domain-containing protein [Saprospiraceae bacterium]
MLIILILAVLSWSCSGSKANALVVANGQASTETVATKNFPGPPEEKNAEESDAKVTGENVKAAMEIDVGTRMPTDHRAVKEDKKAVVTPDVQREQFPEKPDALITESDSYAEDQESSGDSPESMEKVDHELFSTLLTKYVDGQGKVDYDGLKNELAKLNSYLTELKQNPVSENWSKDEQLAYWINAYNAFTIKLILDHYPVASITDIENGKPWDKKWITLGNETYSLNQIENEIIRPQFNEPRIHFAVNCAAKSCPPLANKAFTAGNMEALLESQTKKFINDKQYNQIDAGRLRISKIFDWYGSDFKDLVAFLNKYSTIPINANAKIEFVEYNWSLNN